MTPDTIIAHLPNTYYRGRKFEYWTGNCWTNVLKFAKTYLASEAETILRLRFHRDSSALTMLVTDHEKTMRREGRYAD